MVKISEIVNQNLRWKHGEKFAIFDKKPQRGKGIGSAFSTLSIHCFGLLLCIAEKQPKHVRNEKNK